MFKGADALFNKRTEFAHEQECRFAFKCDSINDGPRRLEIGDISDIAFKTPAKQINVDIAATLRNFYRKLKDISEEKKLDSIS